MIRYSSSSSVVAVDPAPAHVGYGFRRTLDDDRRED